MVVKQKECGILTKNVCGELRNIPNFRVLAEIDVTEHALDNLWLRYLDSLVSEVFDANDNVILKAYLIVDV